MKLAVLCGVLGALAAPAPASAAAPPDGATFTLEVEVERGRVDVGGGELYVVRAGPENGPPVILLHDFAQFWGAWNRQLEALAGAGFRVLAIDERSHHRSDRLHAGTHSVQMLAADVAALIRNTGYRRVAVVGHGAGGSIAWELALQYPARLSKLVVLSAPHPAVSHGSGGWARRIASARGLDRGGEEAVLALSSLLESTASAGSFSDPDLRKLRATWRRAGSILGMLDWDRAFDVPGPRDVADDRIEVETLLLWGAKDPVYPVELAAQSLAFCAAGELHTLTDAGHWLPQEATEEVNRRLLAFLAR